jgi:hypothetical protein
MGWDGRDVCRCWHNVLVLRSPIRRRALNFRLVVSGGAMGSGVLMAGGANAASPRLIARSWKTDTTPVKRTSVGEAKYRH